LRDQAVNIDVKDNEFIDTNGWPFSMRTPAPVAPADSDGKTRRDRARARARARAGARVAPGWQRRPLCP